MAIGVPDRATPPESGSARAAAKSVARRLVKPLERWGYEIRRIPPQEDWVYDPWQVQQQLMTDNPSPVIFDVGANVGQTLENYTRILPHARIHSFEPFPASYERLTRKAAAHPGAVAHRLALADERGERPFNTNPAAHTRNSLLRRPPDETRRYYRSFAELSEQVTVTVETLDGFCQREGIDRVDILKLDIQGAELLALKGARELLRREAIGLIYTEVMFVPHYEGQPLYLDIITFLQKWGYQAFNLYDPRVATNGQLRYANILFPSPRLRENVIDRFPPEP